MYRFWMALWIVYCIFWMIVGYGVGHFQLVAISIASGFMIARNMAEFK